MDEEMDNGKRDVLTANTLVPLGMVAGIILSLVTGAIYFERKFTTIEKQMGVMNHEVSLQLQTIQANMQNRWTSQDMKIWEQQLQIKNPNLVVPDSSAITKARNSK